MNPPDSAPQMLDDAEVERVRKIAEEATTAQETSLPRTGIERRLDAINTWIMSHGIFGFTTTIAMALLAVYTKSRPLADATLVLGIIVQLFGLAVLGVVILGGVLFFWQGKKSPYGPFFHLVKSSAEMDISFVHRLAHCQKAAIQYVLTYYKYERTGFEKRGSLLAGSVERIGLFPALAALVLLVAGLAKGVRGRNVGRDVWAAHFRLLPDEPGRLPDDTENGPGNRHAGILCSIAKVESGAVSHGELSGRSGATTSKVMASSIRSNTSSSFKLRSARKSSIRSRSASAWFE